MSSQQTASTTPQKQLSTPQKRAVVSAEAGPSKLKPQGASPAYVRTDHTDAIIALADQQSSRRHSLYGIEDRIVIDPGSRVWTVGFSGEPDPRAVFWSTDETTRSTSRQAEGIWDLDLERMGQVDRKEAARLVGVRVTKHLRDTFYRHLMTDPKSRKVIVLENTYLPVWVKEHIAEALFENLKVPSVSFTPSSLLALNASGRITGLVVDCGWLETTVTPVYYSRPLFHLSRSTPLAGRILHRRLRALIHRHATYYPPPASLNDLRREAVSPVPEEILTDKLIERILTEVCFVGGVIIPPEVDEEMDEGDTDDTEALTRRNLDRLRAVYEATATSKDARFAIAVNNATMGPGTLLVPGWVRERAAEVLFEDDSTSEADSIQHTILDVLAKLPIDLRPALAGSLLITGGTASLPGFIPRMRIALKSALLPPPTIDAGATTPKAPLHTPAYRKEETSQWRQKAKEPYREIYGLVDRIAILNDPAPLDGEGAGSGSGSTAGVAPRWIPSLLSWVGGSLAGYVEPERIIAVKTDTDDSMLKTGAPEVLREEYDMLLSESIARGESFAAEQAAHAQELQEAAAAIGVDLDSLRPGEALGVGKRRRGWREGVVLKDWTRAVQAA